MSNLLLIFLVALLAAASVVAPAVGSVYLWTTVARALKRDWRRSLRAGFVGVPLLVIPVWIWGSVWAEYVMSRRLLECQEKLGRGVYPTLLEHRLRCPDAPLPPKWPGITTREPMCGGGEGPLPYVYLPVADLGEAARAEAPGWLAHCPRRHKRYWWVPGILTHRDRVVLDASGQAIQVTEAEFQAGVRRSAPQPASK